MNAHEPHPLAGTWQQLYAAILELWRLARPAIEEAAAERGVPMALYDYGELGLETVSVAEFQRRDPYSHPAGFASELARLAGAGWVEPLEGGAEPATARYAVTERARDEVRAIVQRGDDALGRLATLPDAELAWLVERFARVHAANLAAPEPPARWSTLRRFRVASPASPPLAQVREGAMDLFGYRDDAHLAAWSRHADPSTEGARWNAFTHVWSGEARSAAAIARAAAFRGYDEAFYASALADLAARGWIEPGAGGEHRTTSAGRALRDEVERQTDDWFYAPWSVLDGGEASALVDRIARLFEVLRGLPQAR